MVAMFINVNGSLSLAAQITTLVGETFSFILI
jgi:hypothetical protein